MADSYYNSVLTWDHILYSHNNQTLDAFSVLFYLAGLTKTAKLGTCVTPLPLRGPVNTAKLISSLDMISNGRAILGIGAGWHKNEFDLFGLWTSTKDRVRATREGITTISSLLKAVGSGRIKNRPHFECIQSPHPPIWVGTKRPFMIKVAASLADGWIPSNIESDEYHLLADRIRSIRKAKKIERNFSFGYHMSGSRTPSSYIKKIDDLEKAGCEFIAIYPGGDQENYLASLGTFAKDVIPCFS
ncbi:LLM class flavin-dependent oxidoreductase [Nitrososphaera sp.]|uniref:LLM class flavin-dependent oxidoreductase n=1 Tax=Nitrososphaera sp. TaxID=1971748 RepID=UPI001793A5D3|nr:LLM class flavin-dependent oxidoreductase [Nitrososphaera sp.]NWG36685.1 LLM class flavin-dependent oxidoreductase [Nitrososphaera sp.]